MLRDVCDPQLVRSFAAEVSFDQVCGDVVGSDALPCRPEMPWSPALRISSSTWLWHNTTPLPSVSSACTRRAA